MICQVMPAERFVESLDAVFIRHSLTHDGSDFQRKLGRWLSREAYPTDEDGHVAVVISDGVTVGWARTEVWQGHDTLEAFVSQPFRQRGIAAFAAAGLRAGPLGEKVAVFHPSMILVARRAGLRPTLFEKDADGVWRLA